MLLFEISHSDVSLLFEVKTTSLVSGAMAQACQRVMEANREGATPTR